MNINRFKLSLSGFYLYIGNIGKSSLKNTSSDQLEGDLKTHSAMTVCIICFDICIQSD